MQKDAAAGAIAAKTSSFNKDTLEEMSRNLSTTWIDYNKAFNSVPHTWILKSLKLYQICPTITRFARENMKLWKTILHQTTIRE